MSRTRLAGLTIALLLACPAPGGAWPLAGSWARPTALTGPLSGPALERVAAGARLLGYLRWFHPADEAVACRWDAFTAEALAEAERAPDVAAWLPRLRAQLTRVAPTAQVWDGAAPAPLAFPRPPGPVPLLATWRHRGLAGGGSTFGSARTETTLGPGGRPVDGLPAPGTAYEATAGAGLACRVPLALWADGLGTWPRAAAVPGGPSPEPDARATRLAAVATLWAGFQHFHPRLDRRAWAGELAPALAAAAVVPDQLAMQHVLRRLVARVGDGQARVVGPDLPPRALPPIACAWVEGRVLVEARLASAQGVRVGDELLAVDDVPVGALLADELAVTQGATAARRVLYATKTMLFGPPGSLVALRFARPDGTTYQVSLRRTRTGQQLPRPPRPPIVERVAGGAWYVDLTRLSIGDWRRLRPLLAAAPGVVFDLRGPAGGRPWPQAIGALAAKPLRTVRFFVPCPDRPDQADPPRAHVAYTIPADPRPLAGRVAFLADARTLGDAELTLALVRENGLGAIVGEPTAGTAGATAKLALPGGWQVGYTGVAAHWQGGAPLGPVAPTVALAATRAALIAGEDEALERAIALVAGDGVKPKPKRRDRLAVLLGQP